MRNHRNVQFAHAFGVARLTVFWPPSTVKDSHDFNYAIYELNENSGGSALEERCHG